VPDKESEVKRFKFYDFTATASVESLESEARRKEAELSRAIDEIEDEIKRARGYAMAHRVNDTLKSVMRNHESQRRLLRLENDLIQFYRMPEAVALGKLIRQLKAKGVSYKPQDYRLGYLTEIQDKYA
jgi:predicted RNase H-like nuclease (RuvC/YqgF family)